MKDLKYKLVVSDFDGTLTPSFYTLVDETTEAIKRYREAGGKFALCTGRPVSDTSKVLGAGDLECDAVCYSQGAIVHVNGKTVSSVTEIAQIYVPLGELVDIEKEKARLAAEIERIEGEIARAESKLANENFVARAPKKLVDDEREKLKKYCDMKEKCQVQLASL